MSLSFTGWTPSVFRRSASMLGGGPASGGTVQPSQPANTGASLLAGNTSGSPTGDAGLHSRTFMNPLTGNREVAAAASVYGNANVPAYLSDAVNNLNAEQIQRRMQLTSFQDQLMNMYKSVGQQFNPNSSTQLQPDPYDFTGASANAVSSAQAQQRQLGAALQTSALQPGTHLSLGTGWVS